MAQSVGSPFDKGAGDNSYMGLMRRAFREVSSGRFSWNLPRNRRIGRASILVREWLLAGYRDETEAQDDAYGMIEAGGVRYTMLGYGYGGEAVLSALGARERMLRG